MEGVTATEVVEALPGDSASLERFHSIPCPNCLRAHTHYIYIYICVCARNPVSQGNACPVLTFPCSLFHLWFHAIRFAQRNKEKQEKQSVPTLLGLGILMRKPSRASETAKRQRQFSFIFIPASVLLASAKKLRLRIKNSKRSAIGSGCSHKTGRSAVTLQVCQLRVVFAPSSRLLNSPQRLQGRATRWTFMLKQFGIYPALAIVPV